MKKAAFILSILVCLNGCAGVVPALQFMETLGGMVSFSEAADERKDSEDKISVFLENKTAETLVVFVRSSLDEEVEAEFTRIPSHTVKEIRVSRERVIRILGGNSQMTYGLLTCDHDGLFYVVYP